MQLPRHCQRGFDVIGLCGFIAARQQQINRPSGLPEINAIPRPVMNTHLRDTLAHGRDIAEIALLRPKDAHLYPQYRFPVAQGGQPSVEDFRRFNRVHGPDCRLFYTGINPFLPLTSPLTGL
jgi:hypothetical protein